jgi:hypothetical protein
VATLKILDLFDSWILHKASLKSALFNGRLIEVSFAPKADLRDSCPIGGVSGNILFAR